MGDRGQQRNLLDLPQFGGAINSSALIGVQDPLSSVEHYTSLESIIAYLQEEQTEVLGEANTANNVNAGGVGVFKQKNGVDLEFRGVIADSAKIVVALDAPNNEIGIDLGSVALADLSDVTGKAGTGSTVVMDGSPAIVTPTIASFVNSAHDHENAAGGGTLDAAAIAGGLLPVARGGSGVGTLLDHGVLVGSGTSPITPLVVGLTLQYLKGATAADPAFGELQIKDDPTPQLGGDLDGDGNDIAIDSANSFFFDGPAGSVFIKHTAAFNILNFEYGPFFDIRARTTSGAGANTRFSYPSAATAAQGFQFYQSDVISGPNERLRLSTLPHLFLAEAAGTPNLPALSNDSGCYNYQINDKIVYAFKDATAGFTRYKYLLLTGTGVTWVDNGNTPP